MGIASTTETLGGSDYRWLASARGTEHPKSGTVDRSTLSGATVIASGTPVVFDDATGKYEPAPAAGTGAARPLFVYHDVAVRGDDPIVALLSDATVVAEFVPGDHDLVDGRYFADHANDAVTVSGV